jgi:hypothetical protein
MERYYTPEQIRKLPTKERKRIVAKQFAEAAELYSEFYQEDATNVSISTEQIPQNPAKKLTSEEIKRIGEKGIEEYMQDITLEELARYKALRYEE